MTAKNLRELRRLFIALQQRIAHAKMRSAAVVADAHAIRRLQNAGV